MDIDEITAKLRSAIAAKPDLEKVRNEVKQVVESVEIAFLLDQNINSIKNIVRQIFQIRINLENTLENFQNQGVLPEDFYQNNPEFAQKIESLKQSFKGCEEYDPNNKIIDYTHVIEFKKRIEIFDNSIKILLTELVKLHRKKNILENSSTEEIGRIMAYVQSQNDIFHNEITQVKNSIPIKQLSDNDLVAEEQVQPQSILLIDEELKTKIMEIKKVQDLINTSKEMRKKLF